MTRPTDELTAFHAQELLLKRVSEGLDAAEAAELAALGADRDLSLDLAMASIDIATLYSVEDLPQEVANHVVLAVGAAPPIARGSLTAGEVLADSPSSVPLPVDELAAARTAKRIAVFPVIGAYAAAAAGIALAVGAVIWARNQPPRMVDRVIMRATPSPTEARAALVANARDLTTIPWTPTQDPAAQRASGDVVWSASQQTGFMRFVGLAVNDPQEIQYQLWIFDKNRDQAFPVDGGVFNVGPGAEVVIPISATLSVAEPVLFAVTVEKPGGVVVSKRERIVLTAAPSA